MSTHFQDDVETVTTIGPYTIWMMQVLEVDNDRRKALARALVQSTTENTEVIEKYVVAKDDGTAQSPNIKFRVINNPNPTAYGIR